MSERSKPRGAVAKVQPDVTPLAELIRDWLASDAHPDSPGGLAPSTWSSYRSHASRHIIGNPVIRVMKTVGETVEIEPAIKPLGAKGGYAIGHLPVVDFQAANTLTRWVRAMRDAVVAAACRTLIT
jgi:hypothetical protein